MTLIPCMIHLASLHMEKNLFAQHENEEQAFAILEAIVEDLEWGSSLLVSKLSTLTHKLSHIHHLHSYQHKHNHNCSSAYPIRCWLFFEVERAINRGWTGRKSDEYLSSNFVSEWIKKQSFTILDKWGIISCPF